MDKIIVYGSYGYTGTLIVDECRKKNLDVILAGRNASALHEQSKVSNYPYEVVDIDDHRGLVNLLRKGKVVIHCGGPFRHTAKKMADACLETRTHYTDITGEYEVFEFLAGYDDKGKQAGITLIPGTGFDVVPSDCLAVHLKSRLPSATHLQLAFTMSKGGLSRGTKKSMTEGLGFGGKIR
ncbi:MAG: saccharopine dehydrogenase NADP-binding domain-containing protein, partial [Cyclobacteriaceae bacterium]|nr:saccharopine dehydrogenase NADP-binding domain-containing protein [Cyclobacteriaceae bacterium]